MALLAFAMVSAMPYRSFKDLDLKHRVPFVAVLALVMVFVLVSFDPPAILLVIFSAYAVSGAFGWALHRRAGQSVFQSAEDEGTDNPTVKKPQEAATGRPE